MPVSRYTSLFALALVLSSCANGDSGPAPEPEADLVARAQSLHQRVITIDTSVHARSQV